MYLTKNHVIVSEFAYNSNVILSPHVGAYTKKAKIRLSLETLEVWSNYVNLRQVSNKAEYTISV